MCIKQTVLIAKLLELKTISESTIHYLDYIIKYVIKLNQIILKKQLLI